MKKGLDGRFELSAGREGEDKMLKLIFGFELLRPMFALSQSGTGNFSFGLLNPTWIIQELTFESG